MTQRFNNAIDALTEITVENAIAGGYTHAMWEDRVTKLEKLTPDDTNQGEWMLTDKEPSRRRIDGDEMLEAIVDFFENDDRFYDEDDIVKHHIKEAINWHEAANKITDCVSKIAYHHPLDIRIINP